MDYIQTNINNKEYEKVLVDLLSIHQYILKSINKMHIHTKNNANKETACDNSTPKKVISIILLKNQLNIIIQIKK